MEPENPLVFFDGVCNFCNYWVNFAIQRDPRKRLRFSPLQGETARRLLPEYGIDHSANSSVLLLENGKLYRSSAAVLRIYRHLSGGWRLMYGLIVIPAFMRNALYNWVAKHRYKWFGRREVCRIPSEAEKAQFLP